MSLKYSHLEGLEFDIETQNCYTLLRMFYKDNYNIELSDYACPTNWWSAELDLYSKLAPEEGFTPVHDHPRDWRAGDVIIIAVRSSTGNHAAIVLDNGKILHHLVGQRSRVTDYGGMFRNNTLGVYRHKDVPAPGPTKHLVDVREYLPPHVRLRLEELQARQLGAAQEAPAGA